MSDIKDTLSDMRRRADWVALHYSDTTPSMMAKKDIPALLAFVNDILPLCADDKHLAALADKHFGG